MFFVSTAENFADPIGELVGTEQPLRLDYLAFGVDPLGLYGVKLRALGGQKARYYPNPLAAFLDVAVVGVDPTSHPMAFVPARALSQINSRAFLPLCRSFSQHHPRNCTVVALTGLPSKNLSQVSSSPGRYIP